MRGKWHTWLLACAASAWLAAPAPAQVAAGGTITGTVVDEQGAVLSGADVSLRGQAVAREFTTETNGQYRFLNVPPGRYTLTVSLAGFATMVRENVVVVVGQNVDLPFTLRVAAVEETLTVAAETPIVDTTRVGTATNFTADELTKVPNSRDPWALLRTVPGVVMDRVNIAGNETGQQSGFQSKGSRREDAVWTMDGIPITDMAAVGASPTYFDYDAFEEIQIATGGSDISQTTGGVGLNMVVKRGTNQLHGTLRGYYTGDGIEACNVPGALEAIGIDCNTTNHNKQVTDYGVDVGGPILRDKLWFWGSWGRQDIRLVRSAGDLIDRTDLITRNVKVNYQATTDHNLSVLHFLGSKEKFGRQTGITSIEPRDATWDQGDFFPDNPFNGLWKIEDNWVVSPNLFANVKYAYYGTGFSLEPGGGLAGQATIDFTRAEAFGTTRASRFLRPQHFVGGDVNHFRAGMGGTHDIRLGGSYRRTDAFTQTIWPGNMLVGRIESATDHRARLFREGAGTNRTEYLSLYAGDTLARGRTTINVGIRWDRQWGEQILSQTSGNLAFPDIVPGIEFPGFDPGFVWNNVSPRIGISYALDESRRTLLRASFGRYPGQLPAGDVGFNNPSSAVGFVDYGWNDLNGNGFVEPDEVDFSTGVIEFGGGFNPDNPTSVSSANRIDPGYRGPISTGLMIGIDRELMPALAVQVAYNYGRGTNMDWTPWVGLTEADFTQTSTLSGTLPNGQPFSVPIFSPDADKIAANGNARILTNRPGYRTSFHGVEFQVIKRMSNRWMARLAGSYNSPTEHYDVLLNAIGNPTRRDIDPLVSGGQLAPRSVGSGAGDVFMNAKWQINLNGAYQLPWEMEVAGNLFGRHGTPFPIEDRASLGLDGSQRVLVSPELDTFRFDSLWNLDLRWAKNLRANRTNATLTVDLFNVFNSNTTLNQIRTLSAANFERITDNLSPRILRLGLRLTF